MKPKQINPHVFNIDGSKNDDGINSLKTGDIFYARSDNKNIINDADGNYLFEIISAPEYNDELGWFIQCHPVLKSNYHKYQVESKE